MQASTALIDAFIRQIKESALLSDSCEAIRAYEGGNLPVPIKKTYFSFAAEENTVIYTTDENGNVFENNTVTIRMSSFIPLSLSPAHMHSLTEAILLLIAGENEGITGFTAGKTEYDSDVDAYKITSKIYFSLVKESA